MAAANLPKGVLHLELTERMLMTHARDDILPRLKALGARIAIDDFGTGWSSLSRLHELPIDALKIDYSFVRELTAEAGSGEIVRTIVSLAHNLGIDVVAEGVERPEQLRVLSDLGCEYAQGFLLSRPVDSSAVAPLLQRTDWLKDLA
jgi:EAL domain-containing protein (putative c-di-GMP-specific phosphodiesterase class I)